MKISRLFLLAVTTLVVFASCSKDKNDDPKQSTLEGIWIGTYVNESSGNSFFYSFNIKAGGVIEELNSSGQAIGQGTWEMDNNILTAEYTWPGGSKYSIIAAYNKQQGKLLGDWGYGSSATNGGTWQMSKSN